MCLLQLLGQDLLFLCCVMTARAFHLQTQTTLQDLRLRRSYEGGDKYGLQAALFFQFEKGHKMQPWHEE